MAAAEILDLPPREAVEHFRAKGFHVGYDWRETDAAEHLRSFTVAKAMRLDILQDIRTAVDRAIADGVTFETFQGELEPLLRKKGWWGGKLGSDKQMAYRLRTIFDTNLRMSYAKGRWEMIERQAGRAPYLMYDAVNDARTRPEHLAWDRLVLRWDDPFWQTHYPPNGWRCRCRVIQLSEADLGEFGLSPSAGPPAGSEKTRPWHNKITGKTIQVPVGIDPGFGHNVGALNLGRESADRLIAKIDDANEALARAAIGTPWRTPMFRRFLSGASDGDWPIAVMPASALQVIGSRSRTVRLSPATAAKQGDHHPDVTPQDYARAQRALDEGEVFADSSGVVAFIEEDDRLWRTIVRSFADGSEAYLATLHKARRRDLAAAQRRLKRVGR